MKNSKRFSIPARQRSFRYAIEGIGIFFSSEHNAIIHLLASIAVVCLALVFRVTKTEAIALILSMGFVWAIQRSAAGGSLPASWSRRRSIITGDCSEVFMYW